MAEFESLAGKLLISMPGMTEEAFHRTVTLMCFHSPEGALGLTINRPHESVSMEDVVEQMELAWERYERQEVFVGGPVSPERGFVLFEDPLPSSGHMEIQPNLFLGSSPEILRDLGQRQCPNRFFFALGYAGWGEGQLEAEMRDSSWMVTPFDRSVLFEMPVSRRWEMVMRRQGIEPGFIVEAGGTLH
ncbi:MAG: YqgE/AlgH family protein [Magnetococcales bacterium]|nr:YqgE/AlgH family protein [Magnetococcales bacterium]